MRARGSGCAAVLTMLGLGAGCAPEIATWEMPASDARMQMIFRAGQSKDPVNAPRLVRALRSDDPLIRMAANDALVRIAGEDVGFEYSADRAARAAGEAGWREVLAKRGWTGNTSGRTGAADPEQQDAGGRTP